MPDHDPYAFAIDRAEEERRLVLQSQLLESVTEEMLRRAGLEPGMHVLDLGSGAGDTTILAARLVGPTGSVVGVERSPEQAALARRRAAELGIENVAFVEGDVAALGDILTGLERPLDAVMGRLILMWVPDRIAVLRTCAEMLPPGALVWFLDIDVTYDFAAPCPPLWADVHRWIEGSLTALGAELRMGPNLYRLFRDAGLPGPTLEGRTITAGVATAPIWFFVNIVRAFLPMMARLGVGDPAEVGIDTLEKRLTAELAAHDATAIVPPMTIAWCRVPG